MSDTDEIILVQFIEPGVKNISYYIWQKNKGKSIHLFHIHRVVSSKVFILTAMTYMTACTHEHFAHQL